MVISKNIIIFFTLFSILFVSVLVFFHPNITRNRQSSLQDSELDSAPTALSTQTSSVPSDWKTYTNSQYGFSFEYPSIWTIEESQKGIEVLSDKNRPTGDWQMESEGCFPYVQFKITTDISNKSLINWIIDDILGLSEQYFREVKNKEANSLNLGEFSYKPFDTNKFIAYKGDGIGDHHHYSIANKNVKVDFYNSNCNPLFNNNYIDQILSTFKFTDPTVIPSDWKFYSDKTLGISFNYPKDWEVDTSLKILKVKQSKPDGVDIPTIDFKNTNLTANQLITQLQEQDQVFNQLNPSLKPQDIVLNGYQAQKLTYITAVGLKHYSLIANNNSKKIQIDYGEPTSEVINQILSTFKFTSNNEEQLSYVTINYSKYNLAFHIPKGWYFSNDAMNGNYKSINVDTNIDSNLNMLFITDNPNSENNLNIGLDPNKPKEYSVHKQGDSPEFEKIISSIKFQP